MKTKITHNSTDPHFEANLTRLLEINKERQSLLNLAKVLNFAKGSNYLENTLKSFKMNITKDEIANWNNLLTGFINTRISILETEINLLMSYKET